MNNKKEGEYYSQMVRRFRNEYGGENLQDFFIKEKVSYTKMLHCLRSDSYRKPQQHRNVTAKEDLASILPHKWVEPVTIPLVY